jgi:tRNA A37 N6-isopentenylltransferase MiaA
MSFNDLVRQSVEGGRMRRLVVRRAERRGWDVLEDIDNHVVRSVHCDDWHRVERMLQVFELTSRQAARGELLPG